MKDTLVVFYSRTGCTRRLALRIAGMLDADVEEITERHSRRGVFGFARSMFDVLHGRLPRIAAARLDPRSYRTVVIGTPVWAAHVSSPVRSYIVQHADALRRLGLFCTMGSSGGAEVLAEMLALRDPDIESPTAERFPTLAMRADEIESPDQSRLIAFVDALREPPPRRQAARRRAHRKVERPK
jgi:hypothetical protein